MSYDFSRLSVLIVDDSTHMRRLLREILYGFQIRNVREFETVKAATASFYEFPYDLALIDWLMEPVDGLDLVKWIRTSSTSPDPYLPIIMVSAFSEVRRVEAARDAGVNEFLVKPLSPSSLYNKISALVDSPRPFVRCESYFGPDRRRQDKSEMRRLMRRHDDNTGESVTNSSPRSKLQNPGLTNPNN